MQGIILIDKPVGWTSFDVVAYVRKLIASEQNLKPAQVKVGHTGTLDPLASGLMVLLIGKQYTRAASQFSKLDKEYLVEIKLGEVSASGDREIEAEPYSSYQPNRAEVEAALKTFMGPIMQKPPIYSALKVGGRRAYKLARSGQKVELEARPVTIYSLMLENYSYPKLSLKAKVSSGTYIRSLAVDLGEKLTSGAYLTDLKRTEVGKFKLKDSLDVKGLTYDLLSQHLMGAGKLV